MWALYAFGSALFAGLTAVLAKCSIRKTDSTVATAIRTIVVLIFSWVMVFLAGSQSQLSALSGRTLLFLILSGLATGASWLCYFHALQIGDINKVVPVDKSSTVLTILLAVIFLHESLSLAKGAGVVLTGGTALMEGCQELGEQIFNLPTRIGYPRNVGGLKDVVNSPKFSTAVGLLRYGAEKEMSGQKKFTTRSESGVFDGVLARMKKWFADIS